MGHGERGASDVRGDARKSKRHLRYLRRGATACQGPGSGGGAGGAAAERAAGRPGRRSGAGPGSAFVRGRSQRAPRSPGAGPAAPALRRLGQRRRAGESGGAEPSAASSSSVVTHRGGPREVPGRLRGRDPPRPGAQGSGGAAGSTREPAGRKGRDAGQGRGRGGKGRGKGRARGGTAGRRDLQGRSLSVEIDGHALTLGASSGGTRCRVSRSSCCSPGVGRLRRAARLLRWGRPGSIPAGRGAQ